MTPRKGYRRSNLQRDRSRRCRTSPSRKASGQSQGLPNPEPNGYRAPAGRRSRPHSRWGKRPSARRPLIPTPRRKAGRAAPQAGSPRASRPGSPRFQGRRTTCPMQRPGRSSMRRARNRQQNAQPAANLQDRGTPAPSARRRIRAQAVKVLRNGSSPASSTARRNPRIGKQARRSGRIRRTDHSERRRPRQNPSPDGRRR